MREVRISHRLIAVFLTLAVIVTLMLGGYRSAGAASTEKLDSLKEQASALTGQENSLQSQLDALADQQDSKLEEKQLLEQQISVLSAQILTSEELIAAYEEQIAVKQVELKEAQETEEEYYQLFLARFRDMEESGSVSYWSILFSSASFTDLLDRISFVTDIVRYDNQIIEQLCKARDAVAAAEAELENQQAEEEAVKAELENQQAALAEDEAAVEAAIAEIESKSDVYAAQLAEILAQEADLDRQIAQAQAEYEAQLAEEKAAEEAAAKKAAEEAAAKAAAEEAARQEAENAASNNNSGGGASSSGPSTGSGGLIWPTTSYNISSSFGYRDSPTAGASTYHQGIDIAAPTGTPIYAAASGTVTDAGYSASRGNYVVIAHGNGMSTVYMHCSALYVSSGQSVSQGSTIAAVGSTGISTGPHLHFGVMVNGTYVDPMKYF